MKQTIWLFPIIKRSFVWLAIGLVLSLGSLVLFVVNFRPSIEFTWGIQMWLQAVKAPDQLKTDIVDTLTQQWFKDIQVNVEEISSGATLLVSLPFKDDNEVKLVSDRISQVLLEKWHIASDTDIVGLTLNGPSVSDYMKSSTVSALIVGILFIAIYMMFSFASMRKHISPLTLAFVAIATMIFDISIPTGAYALWMSMNHTVTVDTIFVIAIMTTIGYSINDTIIILDRIRENTAKNKEWLEKWTILYADVFESSLWQTMRRSLGTGLSTLLAVIAMFSFWESAMQSFAFVMWVGILAGTYSSIFVWAPLAYVLLGRRQKEFKKM